MADLRLQGLTDRTVTADSDAVNAIRNEIASKLSFRSNWTQANRAQVKDGKIVLETMIDVQGLGFKPLTITLGVDNQGFQTWLTEFHYDPLGKNIHGNLFTEQLSRHMTDTLSGLVEAVCRQRVNAEQARKLNQVPKAAA